MKIVAIDISGRHEEKDGYDMVCAAIEATVSPDNIQGVTSIKISRGYKEPDLGMIVDLVVRASSGMEGVVVAEPGEFYGEDSWRVEAMLGRPFKYAETIGERRAIEFAHHTALAARRALREHESHTG